MGKKKMFPEDAVVIVLGAHVFPKRLSGTLYNRVKAAADLLHEYPGTKFRHTVREGLAIVKFLLFNRKL